MIRLRATVRPERVMTGNCPADSICNQANRVPKIPTPDWIEIEGGHEGGYLLIHIYLREGPFIHTWHSTIEEAKDEAMEDFSITEEDWELVDEEES
jgi:hypothetical protein